MKHSGLAEKQFVFIHVCLAHVINLPYHCQHITIFRSSRADSRDLPQPEVVSPRVLSKFFIYVSKDGYPTTG